MLNKQSTQLLNQLEMHIYTANPEIVPYCKDGVPGWVLNLLMKYPTAKKLSGAKIKAVAEMPYVTEDRAAELIENAKKSVAVNADRITEQLITATVCQVCRIKKTVKSQTLICVRDVNRQRFIAVEIRQNGKRSIVAVLPDFPVFT